MADGIRKQKQGAYQANAYVQWLPVGRSPRRKPLMQYFFHGTAFAVLYSLQGAKVSTGTTNSPF
jgi:hypothetical protein